MTAPQEVGLEEAKRILARFRKFQYLTPIEARCYNLAYTVVLLHEQLGRKFKAQGAQEILDKIEQPDITEAEIEAFTARLNQE